MCHEPNDRVQLAGGAAGSDSAHLELAADDLRDSYPQFALEGGEVGILDRRGGLADPQLAVRAALELAVRAGAEVRTRTRVLRVRTEQGRGVEIEIEGRESEWFDRVLVTTGAFVRDLVPGLPVISRRLLLGWFPPKPGSAHLIQGMPAFEWNPDAESFIYGGPAEGGTTVKIGVNGPWGEVDDAMDGREVTEEDIEPVRAAARRFFPWLDAGAGRYEMHIDGWSADQNGMLGALPGQPGVFVATGWTGRGFKSSPVLGGIAGALMLGREPDFDVSHLDPIRFADRLVQP